MDWTSFLLGTFWGCFVGVMVMCIVRVGGE
ncbi:MAG: DUF3789 domain-containing protein [Phycisphaerae bacterium]